MKYFEMPCVQIPTFPDRDFVITSYGAVGDGIHLNTQAIAKAIEECSSSGGGRVVIPPGVWLTGPITLKSNVNLHLQRGAVVVFSSDFNDYPVVMSHFEGQQTFRCMSPINGENLENIAITGQGIFDGQGQAWRPVKKYKMTDNQWNELINAGGFVDENAMVWWPSKEAMEGAQYFKNHNGKITSLEDAKRYRDFLRPNLLSLVNCKKVLLDGPTFQNSPAWNLHPVMCEHVTIRNVTVRNPWYAQNGDGLDLESCKNVEIYNSTFDVGDDAICMKSGKDEEGRRRGKPCENVRIYNCTVYHGHGGFVVGSEMSGGVRNIHVSNCTFIGTDVGIRFKSRRGRGGVVENIYIENIYMKDIVDEAIILTMWYGHKAQNADDAKYLRPTEETPEFRNIMIKNVVCMGAGRAIQVSGLPELPINSIYFDDVIITSEKGVECVNATDLFFRNVKLKIEKKPELVFDNCKRIEMVNVVDPDGNDIKLNQ